MSPRTIALRLIAGILFPLIVGASGCCGCPIGWCSSLLTSSSTPPVIPVGAGGAGGTGGFGTGLAPTAPSAPLAAETGVLMGNAIRRTSALHELSRDKRLPIRGSLLPHRGGKITFEPHTAKDAVPIGDGSSFVIASSTGLWLHDVGDLKKRARLVPEPIRDVAASPNGSRIALFLGYEQLKVISYPELSTIIDIKVDTPTRMRFSRDGQRLALGSESDTVTLVDLATKGARKVIDTDEDVNDVFPMPDKPNEVAYASDDDEVVVLDMDTKSRVFRSERMVIAWRTQKNKYFMMRDQLTVAYDDVTDTLLSGGDDNMVWRFSNFRTAPKVEDPTEFVGNVVDIACCAGQTSANRAAFVAVDDAQVHAIGLDGRRGPRFGPLFGGIASHPIRISLLPSGDVLIVPNGAVFRWEPRTGITWQSNEYASGLPIASVVDADTVYVLCDAQACVVHRVKHEPTPIADVETAVIGDLPPADVQTIRSFSTGLRAIMVNKDGTLQMAYLPLGEGLEPLLDTKAAPGGLYAERDPSLHGYVDPSGKVYEITAVPRGMRQVGIARGNGNIVGFTWDRASSKWRVVFSQGDAVLVP